jgi:hypothetical protein
MKSQFLILHLSIMLAVFLSWTSVFAQSNPPKKLWTIKTNAISPVFNNVTLEAEFMPWERISLFAGGGTQRAVEDVFVLADLGCTEDRGFGLSVGGKYWLVANRSRSRTINGVAVQLSMAYTLTDQVKQTCPTFVPIPLYKTNSLGVIGSLSWRKTFWDRLVVETVAGIGYSRERLKFTKVPELGGGYACRFLQYYSRGRLSIPVAVNVGVVF